MADSIYDKGRERFLNGDISWRDDDIKMVLVDAALYTPDLAADEFLSDIPSGARIATSPNMTGKTSTAGVADCDDFAFPTVTGATGTYVASYVDTGGADTTCALIALDDSGANLPVVPNGDDINTVIDSGPNKYFKL